MTIQLRIVSVSIIILFIVFGLFLYGNIYPVVHEYHTTRNEYVSYNKVYYHPSMYGCLNHEMIIKHPVSKLTSIKSGEPLSCDVKLLTDSEYIESLKIRR